MIANLLQGSARTSTRYAEKLAGCLAFPKSRQKTDWMVEQLNIQPYQHILEVGYGSGLALEEVASRLKVGFLAGIDPSVQWYQQAYRRNKRFIRQQLMQLHMGELHELSYPSHYFHTVYGSDIYLSWKDPQGELMRLFSLLKNRGKLIMLLQSRREEAAEKIHAEYAEAGLTDIRMEYRDIYPSPCISVTGFKP